MEMFPMQRLVFFAITALTLGYFVVAGRADTQGDRNAIGFAAEGYEQNLQSFRFLTCRFLYILGTTLSDEDARKGKIAARVVAQGLWIQDGPKKRFRLSVTPKQLEAALKNRGAPPGPTHDYATDGKVRVNVSPMTQSAHIQPSGFHRPALAEQNPFLMGGIQVSVLLRESLDPKGQILCRFDGARDWEGIKTLVFATGDAPDKFKETHFLDPNRGFLPVHRHLKYTLPHGTIDSRNYVTEIRRCSQDRWFPTRSVRIIGPSDGKTPLQVHEYRVTELDVDRPPPESAFDLVLPKGYQISDASRRDWLATVPADDRVPIRNLDQVSERYEALAREHEAKRQEARARLAQPNRWLPLLRGSAGVLVLVAAGLIVWRHRWSRRVAGA
jgi:hypothetical protein